MTNHEAIETLKANYPDACYEQLTEVVDMAISALQAQDSETKRICDTCKHNPPSKKWPCLDCDMGVPADRWEAQDVPDTNVGDMISREELFEELNSINLPVGNETVDKIFCVIENIPSVQPERVKCRKCRYVYYDKELGNYWCNRKPDSFMVEEDGYCKWGK